MCFETPINFAIEKSIYHLSFSCFVILSVLVDEILKKIQA